MRPTLYRNSARFTFSKSGLGNAVNKWEYLIVDCYLGPDTWRPRFANRQPLPEWESGVAVDDYCNELGSNGWEMVSSQQTVYESEFEGRIKDGGKLRATASHDRLWRLVFKRIKSAQT